MLVIVFAIVGETSLLELSGWGVTRRELSCRRFACVLWLDRGGRSRNDHLVKPRLLSSPFELSQRCGSRRCCLRSVSTSTFDSSQRSKAPSPFASSRSSRLSAPFFTYSSRLIHMSPTVAATRVSRAPSSTKETPAHHRPLTFTSHLARRAVQDPLSGHPGHLTPEQEQILAKVHLILSPPFQAQTSWKETPLADPFARSFPSSRRSSPPRDSTTQPNTMMQPFCTFSIT